MSIKWLRPRVATLLPVLGTGERDSKRGRPEALPLVVLSYVAALGLIGFGLLVSFPITSRLRQAHSYDVGSFIASGRAAARGLDPYQVYPLTYGITFQERSIPGPNLNPPISIPLFQAIAGFDPLVVFRLWYVVSIALFILTMVLLISAFPEHMSPRRVLWACCLGGLWETLTLGQIYLPLLLASTGALLLLRKRSYTPAGILIGLVVAVKPNFLVWPCLLLLVGYVPAAIAAFATGAVLSVIPVFIYGPSIYLEWLRASRAFSGVGLPSNAALLSLPTRLGAPGIGLAVDAILLAALAWLCWHFRPSARTVSDLAIVASLLTSPIAWIGYTILLLPILTGRRWTLLTLVAALLLVMPFSSIPVITDRTGWLAVVLGTYWSWPLVLSCVAPIKDMVAVKLSEGDVWLRVEGLVIRSGIRSEQ